MSTSITTTGSIFIKRLNPTPIQKHTLNTRSQLLNSFCKKQGPWSCPTFAWWTETHIDDGFQSNKVNLIYRRSWWSEWILTFHEFATNTTTKRTFSELISIDLASMILITEALNWISLFIFYWWAVCINLIAPKFNLLSTDIWLHKLFRTNMKFKSF